MIFMPLSQFVAFWQVHSIVLRAVTVPSTLKLNVDHVCYQGKELFTPHLLGQATTSHVALAPLVLAVRLRPMVAMQPWIHDAAN